ncbi:MULTISPECIES: fimbria/pilus outer membrane usher protein [unclassified Salmonella]|uniref:fimbria/pilus outer membrane usher protein n=1 Tax=unclassified Salmonella TaxID=2614656 RepID=UPI0012805F19|nr:fimbria/pilus outer membrane usher protein [Salmonella sp. 32020501-2019-00050]EBB6210765.1 fimbrial biogenesis outer membrane usher protein [Salmonella enterica]EBZ4665948.1 fimbrial biogenesis outer membrane usher protein [Salmonella enterica subsp. enterica serovar Bovismorbificans]ECH8729959.1 fimbrial biogenesis outer membrane usher protein [Salmonella enterica subsp. enterica]ECH8735025.1 fimbrial biogenesis outer membrane usher protein [Salmonella enterica subsp. enterica serovar Wand
MCAKSAEADKLINQSRQSSDVTTADNAGSEWRFRPLYLAVSLLGYQPALAQDVFFDSGFFNKDGNTVDLTQYEKDGTPEGDYWVDIYLNQQQVTKRKVHFAKNAQDKVVPQITSKELEEMGVAVSRLPGLKKLLPDAPVGDLSTLIPSAKTTLDIAKLRLDISVPQIDISAQHDGYVDPKLWDQGIPGGVFNYTANANKNWMHARDGQTAGYMQNIFASLNGGFNAGAWRLRSSGTFVSSDTDSNRQVSHNKTMQWNNTYLERDIQRLRGELTLGEANTGNSVFDSIPFQGVQLISSDEMLPSSQRGFAPLIVGVAKSNATVTVTQDGRVIYQTSVPPGPFRITDIYQASTSGDLLVTVTESDGSKHISTQAYSALPVMQRPGNFDYEITTGRFHNGNDTSGTRTPNFMLGTISYGLPWNVTLYGGLLGASNYRSAAAGSGLSLGEAGALSVDATLADTSLPGGDSDARGAAYRARYSKSLLSSGTTLELAAFRYTTRNYYSFSDANTQDNRWGNNWSPWAGERKRDSNTVTISQTLGAFGSLYVQGSRDRYWGSGRVANNLTIDFHSSVKGIGYGVNYNIDHNLDENGTTGTNRQLTLNVSIPFSLFSHAEQWRNINANYTQTHDSSGRTSRQMGISGSALNNKASWNISSNTDNQGNGHTGNLALGYNGDNASVNVGYGYAADSQNINASINGGLLLHSHGLVFSPTLGDSVALVSTPGAENVTVLSGNSSTNRQGYATSNYLQSYQRNAVSVDPTTLPDNADIDNTTINVYPTKGAIVEARFKTRIGHQAMFILNHGAVVVPFGAIAHVRDANNEDNSSIVGDGGMIYLSGLPDRGQINVEWGSGEQQKCKAKYNIQSILSKAKLATGVVEAKLSCISGR